VVIGDMICFVDEACRLADQQNLFFTVELQELMMQKADALIVVIGEPLLADCSFSTLSKIVSCLE
jgi:hypothetical protein